MENTVAILDFLTLIQKIKMCLKRNKELDVGYSVSITFPYDELKNIPNVSDRLSQIWNTDPFELPAINGKITVRFESWTDTETVH